MRILAKLGGGIIVLCLVLALSFPAHSEGRNPNYIVLKGGIYSPQNNKLNNFETSYNGEFAFGHYFNKNLALEIGTGAFHTRSSKNVTFEKSSGLETLDLYAVPLTLALKAIIPIDNFELYGIGGGGAYFSQADLRVSNSYRYYDYDNYYNQTLVGGFLGLGASFKITPKFFIGLEGKYLWTSTVTINDLDTDINFNGFLGTINFGFLF
jgi:hypothetical protein